jgi:hypothetical protein
VKPVAIDGSHCAQALFKLCSTCGAILLVTETPALCCGNSAQLVEHFPPLWSAIDFENHQPLKAFFATKEFRLRARAFQNLFRLCYRYAKFSKVRYNGEFLHLQGVIHCNASSTAVENKGGLLFYIVENERTLVARNLKLDQGVINNLSNFLRAKNPYVQSALKQYEILANDELIPKIVPLIAGEHSDPLVLLVPYQAQEDDLKPKDAVFLKKRSDDTGFSQETIACTTREYEALSYPFLFPDGCGSWGVQDNRGSNKITLHQYLKLRLTRDNLLKHLGLISSEYILDMFMRNGYLKAKYERSRQLKMFISKTNPAQSELSDLLSGKKMPQCGFFVHGSTVNSPSFWSNATITAETLAARLGNPNFFMTITGNEKWPEMQTFLKDPELYYGTCALPQKNNNPYCTGQARGKKSFQNSFSGTTFPHWPFPDHPHYVNDHADMMTRIFKAYLGKIMEFLKKSKIWPQSKQR